MRILADAATSSTARSNAFSFALDGLVNPLIFLTNWIDASRISASVAGGSKLNKFFILRHMTVLAKRSAQAALRSAAEHGITRTELQRNLGFDRRQIEDGTMRRMK